MSCKATNSAQARLAHLRTGGLWSAAEVYRDLLEWHYGSYDGRTSVDIHAERRDWLLFRDGNLARSIRMTAAAMGRNVTRRGLEAPLKPRTRS